jgi:hypothetical protein
VAARRGIAYAELEDRLVPELGLDEGPLVLDYGSRTFEVKLDEQLLPFVVVDGTRANKPPRALKRDDKEKTKAGIARFETLAEDLSHVAKTQLLRLERAMREARTWKLDAWLSEMVKHPLLGHVAPRLVWAVDDELVHIAFDGSFANEDDQGVTLTGRQTVRVAHPLDVDAGKWAKMTRLFADYEILQPFPQLARETFDVAKSGAEWRYKDAVGRKVAWSAVDALLTGRGWLRTPPEGGSVKTLELPLGGDGRALLRITPGLTIGRVKARPEQTVGELELRGTTFGALHPRLASELVRDVATL